MNSLKELHNYGQSFWLDYIGRGLIESGELQRLVDEDDLRGITSNPAIFEKAITGSTDYSDLLESIQQKESSAMAVYEELAISDIKGAADVLRSVYEKTNRGDGYVSLEVSPYLAFDTEETVKDARRLWKTIERENLMIKVPATPEGLLAIEQLLSEGININATLLFSIDVYEQVAMAFIAGLEKLSASGDKLSKVAGVASFFVSRIDSAIDTIVSKRIKKSTSAQEKDLLKSLMGKVANSTAKLAYQRYKDIFKGERWLSLAERGAQQQRILWASTSTKNPDYHDLLYVEELIGPDTVNTMPPATLKTFRDQGTIRESIEEDLDVAHDTMNTLVKLGISMKEVTDDLLMDGIKQFVEAFDKLLNSVDSNCKRASEVTVNLQTYTLPEGLAAQVKTGMIDWRIKGKVRKLWEHDSSLWTGKDEGNWLGWLRIVEDQIACSQRLRDLADEIKREGFSHALLLGMGGSSLCPEVLSMTFGRANGFPEFHVLDSTDPAQVKASRDKIDLFNSIFIVSSKSGTTLEPNILMQYFFDQVKKAIGSEKAGDRFIAITDPESKLQQFAEENNFRHIFHGLPSIGGRFSALSAFGMVPASIMGIEISRYLGRADEMVISCSPCLPPEDNSGVVLGTIMGVLAKNGHDKVTIVTSPGICDLGAWLEQLLAESTGKEGKGLIPVDREELGPPEVYGNDRLFVYIRLGTAPDESQDMAIEALEKAGQPLVRISVANPYDLGHEFFRWEIATAVAGSIIGINPFDQPDVEASKVETRKLTDEYEEIGSLPEETPIYEEGGIKLFTDSKNTGILNGLIGDDQSLVGHLHGHLNQIKEGDYFALLAYIEMKDIHEEQLKKIRMAVRDKKGVATCLGFGPRFLHSTGQAYKGGPNTGVFLQITCDDAEDLPVPGQKYTFGIVKAAEARGDFKVLAERNRRALRVHLGSDVESGLRKLSKTIEEALS